MPTLTASAWQDYDLLDSGHGRKLERFGPVTLIRPEAQATWQPALPRPAWDAAHAQFQPTGKAGGQWEYRQPLPPRWQMGYGDLRFTVQASESRQVGVFPENAAHWEWIAGQTRAAGYAGPGAEYQEIGFRVASDVPEPATMGLLTLGGLALLRRRG